MAGSLQIVHYITNSSTTSRLVSVISSGQVFHSSPLCVWNHTLWQIRPIFFQSDISYQSIVFIAGHNCSCGICFVQLFDVIFRLLSPTSSFVIVGKLDCFVCLMMSMYIESNWTKFFYAIFHLLFHRRLTFRSLTWKRFPPKDLAGFEYEHWE